MPTDSKQPARRLAVPDPYTCNRVSVCEPPESCVCTPHEALMEIGPVQVVENGARAAADTGDLRTVLQVAHDLESRGVELRLTTLTSLASACAEHAQVLHRQHALLLFERHCDKRELPKLHTKQCSGSRSNRLMLSAAVQISSLRHFLAAVSQHSAARQADGRAVVQRVIQRMLTAAAMSRHQTSAGQPIVHAVLAEICGAQHLQEQLDLPAAVQVSHVALLV